MFSSTRRRRMNDAFFFYFLRAPSIYEGKNCERGEKPPRNFAALTHRRLSVYFIVHVRMFRLIANHFFFSRLFILDFVRKVLRPQLIK